MSVRPIRRLGDPVLRTACDPVNRFDDALASLVADLVDTVQEPGRRVMRLIYADQIVASATLPSRSTQ